MAAMCAAVVECGWIFSANSAYEIRQESLDGAWTPGVAPNKLIDSTPAADRVANLQL